jgi:signal transduction histidine kinase
MMLSWRKSIRKKLMLLFTANTAAALGIACAVLWAYLIYSDRAMLVNEEGIIAQMLADSIAPALTFWDEKSAKEAMAVLHADPRVVAACVYAKKDNLFTAYHRKGDQTACPASVGLRSFQFTLRYLNISYPILLDQEEIGKIYLRVSLDRMYAELVHFGVAGLLVLLVASLFALLLSARLQKVISTPILHLTQVATTVSLDQDYSIRAQIRSDDEIGVLIEQFNSMMEQVRQRDLKLQTAQEELEERVEQRTIELKREIAEREVIQQELLNAKLVAEEANRAKSAFLANMSHELRTPLNAILGYSEMLEEDAQARGDASEVNDLRRIQSSGRHLLMLIGEVLDLSKIEAGRVEMAMEFVTVGSILKDVSSTIEPLTLKNGNEFVVTADDWNALVYVDIFKYRQCLLNLLSNACKFTDKGKITLSVSRYRDESGEWSRWAVKDTGIGIAEENLKKLFLPFSQVDYSATRSHGGTGLGLAITQRLIYMMDGHIDVETAPGRGSTFCIFLPVRT